MAILHMDNFSGYSDNEDLMVSGVYAALMGTVVGGFSGALTNDPDGVSPGKVLYTGNSGQNAYYRIRKVLPVESTTIGAMTRVWFSQLPQAGWNIPMMFMTWAGGTLYSLTVSSTGILRVHQGAYNGTILYESSAPVITAQGWWHIEMKLVISDTVGSIEVRVEGREVDGLIQTNINTGTTAVGQFAFGQKGAGGGFGQAHYQKDLVVWNDTGTVGNDWLGTCILHQHELLTDVNLNWTVVNAADGVTALNSDPTDITSYIYAEDDPLPSPYQASISPLPEDIVSVKGVQVRYRAAKNDGGDASVQASMVSDPTGTADEALGEDRPITIAQTFWQDIFSTDPKTGAAWLPAALDAANVRINRTL